MSDANSPAGPCHWRMESDQHHQLERGVCRGLRNSSDCGLDQDVGVCRPDVAAGALKEGLKRDANGFLTWFTPTLLLLRILLLIRLVPYPGLAYLFRVHVLLTPTNVPSQDRPYQDSLETACGTLGHIGLDSFRGPHLFTSNLLAREETSASHRALQGGVPHGCQQHL